MRASFIPRGGPRSLPRQRRQDVKAAQDELGRRVPASRRRLPRLPLPTLPTIVERWAERVAA